MFRCYRALIILILVIGFVVKGFGQLQDKEQSQAMYELAGEMLKASQAEDDVRDILVQAADLDTTNIDANFQAGYLHLVTIRKEQAVKYLSRVFRQRPNYRFDLEFQIAMSYQYGLQFDKAIDYYNRYKAKHKRLNATYQGKDKIPPQIADRKIYECNNGKQFVANPKPFAIVNLGPQVNSEYGDYGPVLNEVEDEIIFTSRRLDGNLNEDVFSDNKPYEDIFFSTKVNDKWLKASNIGRTVNIPDHNSNLALSPDGTTLFTYRSDQGGGDIFISELRSDKSWSAPRPLPGEVNSPYYESSMSISPDGKSLYFASERPGGFGGMDIYVCTKEGRNWTNLRNLGPTINTAGSEESPFLDYSGKKLYFSSDSHEGMGGYDIYESTLVNPAKNEWSTPVNLGFPVNTPDNDIYYVGTPDGKRGYYASIREDGLGYLDIYTIIPKEQVKESSTVLPVRLVVRVIDAKTSALLDANVELLSLADGKPVTISAKAKGSYTFTVATREPKNYRLSVRLDGYFPQIEEVTLQSADVVEKTVNKSVGMAASSKVVEIKPLKYVVTVTDSKTEAALAASSVKLETMPDNAPINGVSKGGGIFEFSILSTEAKSYKVTADCPGYEPQSKTVNLAGAGISESVVSNFMKLVAKIPLKYVVTVLDSKTNAPLGIATVKLESTPDKSPINGVSKGAGIFEFSILSATAKSYNLISESAGYESLTQTVNIEGAGLTEKIVPNTVKLVEKPPVIVPLKYLVTIVDSKTNVPLATATARLESTPDKAAIIGISKGAGVYEFTISAAGAKSYNLGAESAGYDSQTQAVTIEGAGTAEKTILNTIKLAVKPPAIVPLKYVVTAVDAKTNKPLSAASIKLESSPEKTPIIGVSKGAGVFEFAISSSAAKSYNLSAENTGYESLAQTVNIEGAGSTEKTVPNTIKLSEKPPVIVPLKYAVTAVDAKTSKPLSTASIKLESSPDKTPIIGVSKGAGIFEFTISSSAAKSYNLIAENAGYESLAQTVNIEGAGATEKTVPNTVKLSEKPPVIVPLKYIVTAVDAKTNKPLSAASVKLESSPDKTPIIGVSKGAGVFEFTISSSAAKSYNLTAENAGYENLAQTVNIEGAVAAEKTVPNTIKLFEKPPVIVPLKYVVTAVDAKTNKPLSTANIKLESSPDKTPIIGVSKGVGIFEFTISSSAAKSYSLTAESAGYESLAQTVNIEGAGAQEKVVTFTLKLVDKPLVTVAIKYIVKVVDSKTTEALESSIKLESVVGRTALVGKSTSAGTYEFEINSKTPADYTLSVERNGYTPQKTTVSIEAATPTAKTVNKVVSLVQKLVEVVSVPVKLTVRVVDEKTKMPIDANLKLETPNESVKTGIIDKIGGAFDFNLSSAASKDYTLTVDKSGYVSKSEKFSVEGATATPKNVVKTIVLSSLPIETKTPELTAAIKLTVSVVDKNTKAPLEANVVLQSSVENKEILGKTLGAGAYEFLVTSTTAKNYKLSVDKEGYVFQAQQLKIEGATNGVKPLSKTITLNAISVGATSVLRNLYFDPGRATIQKESHPELNAFVNMMSKNPSVKVEISGHTDNVGDAVFNKNLSQLRANAIRTYLVSKGISATRITTIGYGEARPLVSNDDEEGGREINRRVELKILSK